MVATLHPATGRDRIRAGVQAALQSDLPAHTQPHADSYELKVRFVKHGMAYKYAFYPGAAMGDDSQTVVFRSDAWWDVITFLGFIESG